MSQVTQLVFRESLSNVSKTLAWAIFAVSFYLQGASGQTAQQEQQAQQELEATASAIEDIRAFIATANQSQSREEDALRRAETELAQLTNLALQTQSELNAIRSELSSLQLQSQALKDKKNLQLDTVAQLLRAAYMQQQPGSLKQFFDADNLSRLQRMLHYTKALSAYQLGKISEFETTLSQLAIIESDVAAKLEQLDLKNNELQKQMASVEVAKQEKQNALSSLRASIARKGQELSQLEANQAELQQLIEQIRVAMEGVSSFADVPPLNASKGRLTPPIQGRISSGFGQTYGEGSLRRQGMVLEAETGTAVRAIHPGQVVFADWLRGSGLLLIVDHGEGYMSLYGNNEALSANAGDWVDAGDILATSGTSISTGVAGLYFEIRYRGQPQDPAPWLNLDR